jgi:hypothetical protein
VPVVGNHNGTEIKIDVFMADLVDKIVGKVDVTIRTSSA